MSAKIWLGRIKVHVLAIRIGRITSAYNDDKLFSVDLVGAVSDFCTFGVFLISELFKLGPPARVIFEEDA